MSPAIDVRAASSERRVPRSGIHPASSQDQPSTTRPEIDHGSRGTNTNKTSPSRADIHKIPSEALQRDAVAALAVLTFLLCTLLGLLVVAFEFVPARVNAALATTVACLITYRLCTLLAPRYARSKPDFGAAASPGTQHLPAVYMLYVLGSGGHTTEMASLMRRHLGARNANMHRRYVYTSGDAHSPNAIGALETAIREACGDGDGDGGGAGTFDAVEVARARRVHQPFWTSAFSSLRCALDLASALTRMPTARRAAVASSSSSSSSAFRYPHVVVTNGPGTGFVVGVVAWLLKLLGLAPADRLRLVYVETWAHVETLSLTGTLFHYTGLADVFCVQHRRLAERYGKLYIDLVS